MVDTSRLRTTLWLSMLAHTFFCGTTFLIIKRLLADMSAITLLTTRLILVGACFGALLATLPEKRLPPRASLGSILLLGLLVGPMNQGLAVLALSSTRATHAAVLYAMVPVGVSVLSVVVGHERAVAGRFLGIAVALLGALIVVLRRGGAEALGPLKGDLYILIAVCGAVCFVVRSKRLINELGPVRATAWSFVASALWTLPAALWMGSFGELAKASTTTLLFVAYLVLFTSVVPYLINGYALSRVEASTVSVFCYFQPVVTTVLAWAILGETPGWQLLAGGALVLLGVHFAQRGKLFSRSTRVALPEPHSIHFDSQRFRLDDSVASSQGLALPVPHSNNHSSKKGFHEQKKGCGDC